MHRHATERRLERKDAAMRRRQAHRAADVGAKRQRGVAGDGRGAGTGARARGVAVEPPRVARHAVQAREPGRGHAVVRHGGLAKDHAARFAHARRGRRVSGLRRRVLVRPRADRRRIAARVDVLLDGERHAVERRKRAARPPALVRRARLLQRRLGAHAVHGIDARLPGRDALESRARRVDRRELALGIAGSELARAEFVDGRHRSCDYILRAGMTRTLLAGFALMSCATLAPAAGDVRLWHALDAPMAAQLERLAAEYNAAQDEFQVRLAPLRGAKSKGLRRLGLPLNTARPVLYYNRDAFRRAKLNPQAAPKTWYEMAGWVVSRALPASGPAVWVERQSVGVTNFFAFLATRAAQARREREILEEELEAVWRGGKTALDALDSYSGRTR